MPLNNEPSRAQAGLDTFEQNNVYPSQHAASRGKSESEDFNTPMINCNATSVIPAGIAEAGSAVNGEPPAGEVAWAVGNVSTRL